MTAQQMIEALLDSGLTQMQIADGAGMPQSTVSKLLRGDHKDTSLSHGLRLIELHQRVCGKRRQSA